MILPARPRSDSLVARLSCSREEIAAAGSPAAAAPRAGAVRCSDESSLKSESSLSAAEASASFESSSSPSASARASAGSCAGGACLRLLSSLPRPNAASRWRANVLAVESSSATSHSR